MSEILEKSIMETLSKIIGFFTSPLESLAMELFQWVFGGMNSGLLAAFDNPILLALCYIANACSWCIFIFGLPFYFLKIVKEERRNWAVIFTCIVNTIVFIALNQLLAKVCFIIPSMIIAGLKLNLYAQIDSFQDLLSGIGNMVIPDFNVILLIILVIAVIAFGVVTLMRVGAMFTQMLIAPFYVAYVLLGDNQKVSEWILGTVAAGFTYVLQYALFYAGIMILWFGSGLTNTCIALSSMLASFAAPKALQKFGWSSGAAHTFQSTATSVSMLAMRFMPRGV